MVMIKKSNNQNKFIQAGLDVGSNKICCAISETNSSNGETNLLGIGISMASGIKKGTITHRDNLIDEMEKALNQAELMANLKVESISLGISGEHIRGINTQGAVAIGRESGSNLPSQNEITNIDMKNVLEMAKAISLPIDRDILHVLPQEYIIDTMNSIKDPVGLSGRRLEAKVHVITVASTAATNLIGCVEELGIAVDEIVYQGLASSESIIVEDEKNLGVVSVDIGSTTTDIVIYYEGGIRHTCTLGIGSDSITNDIAVMLQIKIEDAEKIKKTYGSAKASMSSSELKFELPIKNGSVKRKISENEVSQYVEARMAEILDLVMKEVNRTDLKGKLTYGMVITGGGSLLKNLSLLAEETISMPIRLGSANNVNGPVELITNPSLSGAIGLSRWKNFEGDINIFQEKEKSFESIVKKLKGLFRDFF